MAEELVVNPPWLTRIETGDGRILGAGFLVDDRLVVTCAHVVPRPAASSPTELVARFVHARDPVGVPGVVHAADHHAGDVDVALVRLARPAGVPGALAPLVGPSSLAGHRLVIKGFPVHKDWGDTVKALAVAQGGPQARWWELHGDAGDAGSWIDEGFSGGPVWSETADGVVGLTVAVATASGEREAYALPLDVLLEVEPALSVRVRPVFEDPQTEDRLRHQLASLQAGATPAGPRVIGARYGLAVAILANGTALTEARELLERCLDEADAAGLPPAHTYGMLLCLSDVLAEQRCDRESLERLEQARRIGIAGFGPDDPRLGPVEEKRALTLGRLGDRPRAEAALARARELGHDASGMQLASLLFSRALMGAMVDPDDAQRLARRSLDLTRTLGPDHPAAVRPLRLLGSLLAQRNSGDAARRHLTEARDIAERHYSTNHPAVADCWLALGDLELQTDPTGALDPCLQALRKAVGAFGDDHPRLVPYLLTAARAHQARGNAGEAARLVDRAVALAEASPGGSIDLADALMARAMCRGLLGEASEALADAERSAELLSSVPRDPPPAAAAAVLASLARVRMVAGEQGGAERAARRALELLDGTPFARDPVAAHCRTVVGMVLAGRNDHAEAEEHLAEALRICEAWHGADHFYTGEAHLVLAGVQRAQWKLKEAERSVRRGIDILERSLPRDHPALTQARRMAGPATRAKRLLDRRSR